MDLAGIRAYAFGFYLRRAQLTYELYLPVTPEMAAEALPVLVDLNRSWTEFIASCDLDGRSRQRIERLWDRVDNLAEVRDYGNNGYYPSEPDEIPRVLDSASQLIQKTIERSADNIQFGYLAGLAVGYVDLNEEGQLSLDDEDEDAIGAFTGFPIRNDQRYRQSHGDRIHRDQMAPAQCRYQPREFWRTVGDGRRNGRRNQHAVYDRGVRRLLCSRR